MLHGEGAACASPADVVLMKYDVSCGCGRGRGAGRLVGYRAVNVYNCEREERSRGRVGR